MKFEYYVTEIKCADAIGIRAMLSQFGHNGWELVSASGLRHTGRTELVWSLGFFIFKRCIDLSAQKIEAEGREARKVLMEESEKAHAHLRALRKADREEIRRHSGKQPDTSQVIKPLFLDCMAVCASEACPPQYVAVCASVGCPQFDSPNQKCKSDGELLDRGAVCSVYYARRGRKPPEGIACFMQEGVWKEHSDGEEKESD